VKSAGPYWSLGCKAPTLPHSSWSNVQTESRYELIPNAIGTPTSSQNRFTDPSARKSWTHQRASLSRGGAVRRSATRQIIVQGIRLTRRQSVRDLAHDFDYVSHDVTAGAPGNAVEQILSGYELTPFGGHTYSAFVDAAGGSGSDSMTRAARPVVHYFERAARWVRGVGTQAGALFRCAAGVAHLKRLDCGQTHTGQSSVASFSVRTALHFPCALMR
jgi:hypothetical protein